ncbi:MAG: hypothetical protein P1P69_08380 [Methanosarcinaceae archaeon]|nr:hypothetical protein [Methanosarcinaceae archaeon]
MSDEIKDDTHGRIESFDQSVRSLERRLRAVERRLSIEVPPEDSAGSAFDNTEKILQQTRTELSALVEEFGTLKTDVCNLKEIVQGSLRADMDKLSDSILQLGSRLDKLENQNKITIGSIKVPVELSGVVGAGVLLVTGTLIFADRWDIIRSPYFSFGIAGVLAAAVFVKFYLANKTTD